MNQRSSKSDNLITNRNLYYKCQQSVKEETSNYRFIDRENENMSELYPIGDSQDVDELQLNEEEYLPDDDDLRGHHSRIPHKVDEKGRFVTGFRRNTQKSCTKDKYLPKTCYPSYYFNEGGDYKQVPMTVNNTLAPSIISKNRLERYKREVMMRNLHNPNIFPRNNTFYCEKKEKSKVENNPKETNVTQQKLKELFIENNKLFERKNEDDYCGEEERFSILHRPCQKQRESKRLQTSTNTNTTDRMMSNVKETRSTEHKLNKLKFPDSSKNIIECPLSYSYEFEKNKIVKRERNHEHDQGKKTYKNSKRTEEKDIKFNEDNVELKKINDTLSCANCKSSISDNTIIQNYEIDRTVSADSEGTLKINNVSNPSKKSNSSNRSKNFQDIVELQRSKCSIFTVIIDGQQKVEKSRQQNSQTSKNENCTEIRFMKNQNIQVNSPEENVSLQIIKSDFMSNMFKEFRDFHLQNIVQEVQRLRYLDILPEKLVEKNNK